MKFNSFLICSIPVLFAATVANPPNLVFIIADDMGINDVNFYNGTDCLTPHLDSLAAEGLRLDSFYTYPMCAPSRAAFMTGRYPSRYGMQHISATTHSLQCGLPTDEVLFAEKLQNAGYSTYMLGKWCDFKRSLSCTILAHILAQALGILFVGTHRIIGVLMNSLDSTGRKNPITVTNTVRILIPVCLRKFAQGCNVRRFKNLSKKILFRDEC